MSDKRVKLDFAVPFAGTINSSEPKVPRINSAPADDFVAIDRCIDTSMECFKACTALIPHCLKRGGDCSSGSHILRLSTCAAICETSARFMLLRTDLQTEIRRVCVDVCTKCADECESMSQSDEQMQLCAELCRRCAEACSHAGRPSIAGTN